MLAGVSRPLPESGRRRAPATRNTEVAVDTLRASYQRHR